MSILEELHKASFNGAEFLIKSTSTAAGRKTVIHEYPNTSRRFVEDLGELQETFSLEGIVHGDNYFADRDKLIAELKSDGQGELVHPFFGTVTVVAQPFTVVEDTTSLGVATFSMTFDRSEVSIFPIQAVNNVSFINELKDSVVSKVQTSIAGIFEVARNSGINYEDATAVMGNISDAFEINSDSIFKVKAEINDFNDSLNIFTTNINKNAFNATGLAADFTGVFKSFELLGNTANNQFDILRGLFGFGSDQEEIPQTTLQRIERKKNRDILNSAMRTNSLAQAYNVVTSATFATESDIKETQDLLDDQFEFVLNDNSLSTDTINDLKNLRVEVRKFLEEESVNAFKISEVQTKEISATVFTYQYYGSVDNTQAIIDLNNSKDPTFLEGAVDVLVS